MSTNVCVVYSVHKMQKQYGSNASTYSCPRDTRTVSPMTISSIKSMIVCRPFQVRLRGC